jgi:serine/threonine protein kinase
MEWLQGGELFERLVSKYPHGYNENIVKEIVSKIAESLKYLHRRGIIHRDLKVTFLLFKRFSPKTFCLFQSTETQTSKLQVIPFLFLKLDFGLAEIIHRGETLSLSCGSARYVAPEIILGDCYSFPADVWSLGVITFILLCGYAPFDGETEDEILRKIAIGDFSFEGNVWKKITPEAKELICRMLEKEPEKRIKTEEILSHPWFNSDRTLSISDAMVEIAKLSSRKPRKFSFQLPKMLQRRHTLFDFRI